MQVPHKKEPAYLSRKYFCPKIYWDNFYFAKNLQGDIIAIYNASGSLQVKYTYDPYGNITSTTNGSGTAVAASAAHIANYNPFRYRGYRYDTDTGFYYLKSRYYDPELGRFINADGFASTGQGLYGCNMFAYCLNNPVRYTDSEGVTAVDMAYYTASTAAVAVNPIALVVVLVGGIILIDTYEPVTGNDFAKAIQRSEAHEMIPSKVLEVGATTASQSLEETTVAAVSWRLPSFGKLSIRWNHILSGHTPGGSRNINGDKSLFYLAKYEIYKAIYEAYTNGQVVKVEAGKNIKVLVEGYSNTYNLMIRIWINLTKDIIETAYPSYGN